MLQGSVHPIRLEIFRNLFSSVAEEMGTVLQRTAYSPNIKERRDYSCAVFDWQGRLLAMGDHMPVHLGSMPLSVESARRSLDLGPGDVAILNDPYAGGTHLPDITMLQGVFSRAEKTPIAFLACRAHHADVGGISPGSMPLSKDIFQEGIRIPPVKLYRKAELNADLARLLFANVRTPVEREGDLAAQVGALKVGERRVLALHEQNGSDELRRYMQGLQDYAQRLIRAALEEMPDGVYSASDALDDDGSGASPVKIQVSLQVRGEELWVDFSGSDPQVEGPMNAVYAVTLSAIYYVLRCLGPDDMPSCAGMLSPVKLVAPEGTVINARFPAATAAGNVETSQRLVDTLLLALAKAVPSKIQAASSGTMNNLTIGGIDPKTGLPFTHYETIGGGMGASPEGDGDSGIHTHMTNSLNTPIEVLENHFPIRVREYRLRRNSGGRGRHRGGDGIVRSLQVLTSSSVTILSERRRLAPYGLEGGESGKKGLNYLWRRGRRKNLPGKVTLDLAKDQTITIETPGGGGWGVTA